MHQDRPSADRRQRRDTRPERHDSRSALVDEEEFLNSADPTGYASPSAPLQIALNVLMNDLNQL